VLMAPLRDYLKTSTPSLSVRPAGTEFILTPAAANASADPSPHFSRDCMFPGNANLPIGVLPRANREIGVPRLAPTQFTPTVPCDWKAIPFGSHSQEASLDHGYGPVPFA
jgi:hypothetical protein